VLIGLICADYTNEVQTGLMNASWINQVLNQVLIAWSPGGLCWSPVVLVSMGLCLVSIVPAWSPGISLGLQGSLLVFSGFTYSPGSLLVSSCLAWSPGVSLMVSLGLQGCLLVFLGLAGLLNLWGSLGVSPGLWEL